MQEANIDGQTPLQVHARAELATQIVKKVRKGKQLGDQQANPLSRENISASTEIRWEFGHLVG